MRKVFFVFVVAVAVASYVQAGKANPIGSFQLDAACAGCSPESLTPNAGDVISFTGSVSGLPENGGATNGGFIDLVCTQGNQEVSEVLAQPLSENTQGFLPVHFALAWDGMGEAQCTAYLYWSGWNNIRRRNTNTLATISFVAGAQ